MTLVAFYQTQIPENGLIANNSLRAFWTALLLAFVPYELPFFALIGWVQKSISFIIDMNCQRKSRKFFSLLIWFWWIWHTLQVDVWLYRSSVHCLLQKSCAISSQKQTGQEDHPNKVVLFTLTYNFHQFIFVQILKLHQISTKVISLPINTNSIFSWVFYPIIVSFVVATMTYPRGFGRFLRSNLNAKS